MKLTSVGSVLALFVSKEGSSIRNEQNSISLDTKGIISDKFYNKDTQRSILITSYESYLLAKKHDITIPYGSLGENILIDYNPYSLPPGTQMHIGTCILEISQNCTLCNHLSKLHPSIPRLLKNDRGIFAKVIQEGEIKKKDTILIK
jgi:MOSC domain-containing protein YiiM